MDQKENRLAIAVHATNIQRIVGKAHEELEALIRSVDTLDDAEVTQELYTFSDAMSDMLDTLATLAQQYHNRKQRTREEPK